MADAILSINAGSSSIKFALFEIPAGGREAGEPVRLLHGEVEGIGTAPHFVARAADGALLEERRWPAGAGHRHAFADILAWIDGHLGEGGLAAAGHRVVHGGRELTAPVVLDERVMAALERLTPLAPLHQPPALAAIRAIGEERPRLLQYACFDTAFHRGHAAVVDRFALPRALEAEGVLRYGFHGISYAHIADVLPRIAPRIARGRVVVAHLGNGASLCALEGGRSRDTTMSFTALDGLVMGTRPGALDPGVVLYLLRERRMSPAEVEDLLWHRSGLLGVSGVSSDMRALLASPDPRAAEAVELFAFRIARETAAMAATLGGLDGVVFTAGIGERSAPVRRMVAERLAWLGLDLDPAANEQGGPRISREGSRLEAWVIPTDEERMIARAGLEILAGRG